MTSLDKEVLLSMNSIYIFCNIIPSVLHYGMVLGATKPVFVGLRTTKACTSLRICTVGSASWLFGCCKLSYLDLLLPKFQFSS